MGKNNGNPNLVYEKNRAECLLVVFFLSFGCKCSVSIPRGAEACSVICACGITW